MPALIKACNTFSKFVNNTEQKRNVCVHKHVLADSYMHKYCYEKFTYTQRAITIAIAIRKYLYIV